jgi:23S rRNA-/tRNA-specific pseudouridylate synthase
MAFRNHTRDPNRPLDWPVPLIASGGGWIVVDKPAGMSVHNEPGRDLCSLMAAWLRAQTGSASDLGCDPRFGVHAVHRLDRETSGLLLLACRRDISEILSREFVQGRVEKEYLALVHGLIPAGAAGSWEWPLSPSAGGRNDPQGRGARSASLTRYHRLESGRRYTLLSCRPLTGRQHQIRRHAALAGHAILGDRRYGSPRACRYLAEHHNFTRLALHAAALTLRLPDPERAQRFESPELPEAIRALLDHDSA